MKITLDDTSSMFGLTVKNLKTSAMQKYLRSKGMVVTFPDARHAIIESKQIISFNADFMSAVEQIELAAERDSLVTQEPELSGLNECSWSVLNGFLWSLGAAAVATAVVALLGASAIMAASIGLGVGLVTLFAYSLFKPPSANQQEMPAADQPNLSLS